MFALSQDHIELQSGVYTDATGRLIEACFVSCLEVFGSHNTVRNACEAGSDLVTKTRNE